MKHAKKQEKITNCKLRKQEMKRKTCFFSKAKYFERKPLIKIYIYKFLIRLFFYEKEVFQCIITLQKFKFIDYKSQIIISKLKH